MQVPILVSQTPFPKQLLGQILLPQSTPSNYKILYIINLKVMVEFTSLLHRQMPLLVSQTPFPEQSFGHNLRTLLQSFPVNYKIQNIIFRFIIFSITSNFQL